MTQPGWQAIEGTTQNPDGHPDSTPRKCEMAQDSPPKSVQQIGDERRHLLEIVRDVSNTIGTEFFSTLVKHLRRALGAKCVYVCEFVGRQTERARTLGACMEGDRMETLEFPIAGSPDAEVALGHPYLCSRGVREVLLC
jgi:hypothetical protein